MVSTSLFTGLSGLRAHQSFIEVVGNNLANSSTPGFWGSRITFGDILSMTLRSGSGPNNNLGGQNPMQIGLGTQTGSIDANTAQGTFADTGRPFDVAMQGRGFFTLSDGSRQFYTRVGTFGVDAQRALIDLRTGLRVVGAGGSDVTVPQTDTLPPQATSRIAFQGNLPAEVGGPLEEIVESSAPFFEGTAAQKLAQPPSGTTYDVSAFAPNGTILVSVGGGAQQTVQLQGIANPSAATAAEIAAAFSVVNGLTATPNGATGEVALDTVKLGIAATLKLDDGPSSSGLLQALGLDQSLSAGTETAATAATDVASLTARVAPYVPGDRIAVTGTNPDGTPVSDTFVYGTDGTTLGDLLGFMNGAFDPAQATATLEPSGALRLTALQKQEATLSFALADVTGNSGSSSFPSTTVLQEGTGPDSATTSIDVIDTLGRAHAVTMTFTRSTQDPAVWDMAATVDAAEGTVPAATVSTIRFNPDGSFNVVGGGSSTLSFLFNGLSTPQAVAVDLGTSGTFNGISMVGSRTTVAATEQDGFPAGELINVAFEASGVLRGFYSNGQTQALDQLRITMFPNEGGLRRIGDTLLVESANSDGPIATTAGAAGAGTVRPGSLENSNVDIAEEFVKLIAAQRGFQANARIVTTADEILAELINIVR